MKPSESFRQWLDDFIGKGSPGDLLPPVPELASRWSISKSTVRRTLEAYQEKGRIIRIPGRGSIIPTSVRLRSEAAEPQPRHGWEYTAEALRQAIFQGRFRKGRPLPSINRIALDFHITRTSVIRAYRYLEESGYIQKIGKRFWTGNISDRLSSGVRRKIILFKQRHPALRNVYSDEALYITRILTVMENELSRHGYIIEYAEIDSIGAFLKRWSSQRSFPNGVIIWALHYNAKPIREAIEGLVERLNRHDIPTLMIAPQGPISVPRCVKLFSHGSVVTQQMRTVASYVVSSGFRSATLFLNDFIHITGLQRLYPELLQLNPAFTLWYVVAGQCDLDAYFDTMKPYQKRALLYFLSKYRPISLEEYRRRFTVVETLPEAYRRFRKSDIWLFSADRDAVEAFSWAEKNGIQVPQELSILSFENDPSYYEYGISTCIKDNDQTGYLMAHALMRDIPILTTSSGFVKSGALFLHRKTTR